MPFSARITPKHVEPLLWFAAALVFVAWLVWGPLDVMQGTDYVRYHHYARSTLRDAFFSGEFPFWNPYATLGRPFLADPEVAAFYPATWLYFFLPEAVAYWIATALHFALAGWGMARLCRTWGSLQGPSVIAGIAFVITTPFLGSIQGGLIGMAYTFAWWPWVLFEVDRFCERWCPQSIVRTTALLAAAFLAGHPHAFWLCGCSYGFYVLPRCCVGSLRESARRLVRGYSALLLASVGAFALTAIQVLPLLELVDEGNRVSDPILEVLGGLPWEALATLWAPNPGELSPHPAGILYCGLPLALIGSAGLLNITQPRMRALLFTACVVTILALGRKTPAFGWLSAFVPAMSSFRLHHRFAAFLLWAVIIAGACFWRTEGISKYCRSIVFGTILITLLANATGCWSILIAVLLLAAFLLSQHRFPPHRTQTFLFGAWALVLALDSSSVSIETAHSFLRYFNEGESNKQAEVVRQYNNEEHGVPPRWFLPSDGLHANSGAEIGVSLVASYGALCPARTWYYLHVVAGVPPDPTQTTFLPLAIFARGPFPYKGANIVIGWDETARSVVHCPPDQLGSRAWLTGSIVPAFGYADALRRICDGFHPQDGALIEPEYQPKVAGITPHSPNGTAEIQSFRRNRIELDVRSPQDALVVVAEAWYPGWSATVDGHDEEVFPVNTWMRAVRVPAGRHRVILSYLPEPFVRGAVLSILAIATWGFAYRRYRTPSPQPR